MRELRTYELDGAGIPVSWRVRHGERHRAGRPPLADPGGAAPTSGCAGEASTRPRATACGCRPSAAAPELAYTPAALSWRRLLFAALLLARRLRAPRTAAFGDCPQSEPLKAKRGANGSEARTERVRAAPGPCDAGASVI